MQVKLLISGESNSGKTTLTKELQDSLIISHDGKRYPFPNPHATIASFSTAEEIINFTNEKIEAYNTKYNNYPETIVFDSVSRIFDTLYDACNSKFSGFAIYSELDKNIKQFINYVEDTLIGSGFNVIILSHAIFDVDANKYNLVGKGSFGKIGGFLSTVDEGIFIETKNNKRILHFRSTKFPARTLIEDTPDSVEVSEFSLTDYINHLNEVSTQTNEFSL